MAEKERAYDSQEIGVRLAAIPGWSCEDGALARTYETNGWGTTLLVVNAIGYRVVDEEALAKARSDLDRPLRVLDGDLSTRPWLLGDRFTVADLNVASVLDWQRTTKLDLSPYPHVADWLSRCLGRPAFKGLSLG